MGPRQGCVAGPYAGPASEHRSTPHRLVAVAGGHRRRSWPVAAGCGPRFALVRGAMDSARGPRVQSRIPHGCGERAFPGPGARGPRHTVRRGRRGKACGQNQPASFQARRRGAFEADQVALYRYGGSRRAARQSHSKALADLFRGEGRRSASGCRNGPRAPTRTIFAPAWINGKACSRSGRRLGPTARTASSIQDNWRSTALRCRFRITVLSSWRKSRARVSIGWCARAMPTITTP